MSIEILTVINYEQICFGVDYSLINIDFWWYQLPDNKFIICNKNKSTLKPNIQSLTKKIANGRGFFSFKLYCHYAVLSTLLQSQRKILQFNKQLKLKKIFSPHASQSTCLSFRIP